MDRELVINDPVKGPIKINDDPQAETGGPGNTMIDGNSPLMALLLGQLQTVSLLDMYSEKRERFRNQGRNEKLNKRGKTTKTKRIEQY